jgi:hypothetical protein
MTAPLAPSKPCTSCGSPRTKQTEFRPPVTSHGSCDASCTKTGTFCLNCRTLKQGSE